MAQPPGDDPEPRESGLEDETADSRSPGQGQGLRPAPGGPHRTKDLGAQWRPLARGAGQPTPTPTPTPQHDTRLPAPDPSPPTPTPTTPARHETRLLGPDPSQPARAWGSRPGRLGPSAVIIGAVLGALVTVLAGAEPGTLLGLFVITATGLGAFAVRPGSVYLIIPVPAPAYLAAAVLAGLIHDRASDTSGAILAVNALEWIANGFFAMSAATLLAMAVALWRWLMTGRAAYWRGRTRPAGRPASPVRENATRTQAAPDRTQFAPEQGRRRSSTDL